MTNEDILAHAVLILLVFALGFMAAVVLISYLDYKQEKGWSEHSKSYTS